MADSPGSPLSSLPSDDFTEDIQLDEPGHTPEASTPQMPPSKRRRTGGIDITSRTSLTDDAPGSPTGSISSDSSGELPTSPATLAYLNAGPEDDYSGFARDQITVCQWEGCDAGDMGNMDALVQHIHEKHIGVRQKKYLCEWGDCARKGQTHASAYALKAHMRSHTKEKPFYCLLPECDRAFTRSDALTKHMRSVHETEAVRLADSISKSQGSHPFASGPGKFPRLKLKFSQPLRETSSNDDAGEIDDLSGRPDTVDAELVSPALGFDEHELSLPLDYLFRLLRKQLVWAEQETERLNREWEVIMEERRAAWKLKEAVLENVIQTELRAFNSTLKPEDFAIGNGVSSVGGDSTITAESSLRASDVAPESGMSSHRGVGTAAPPSMERMEA